MNYQNYVLIIGLLCFSLNIGAQNKSLEYYESYFLFQGVYPNDDDAFWFPNNTEVQGVTNDGENWFITTTGHKDWEGADYWGKLWRIPKSVPLGANSTTNTGVKSIDMRDIPALNNGIYWHWGDPDHYRYKSVDYILVPIYPKDKSDDGIIACFRAKNLDYVSYAKIGGKPGWCAIDDKGNFYSSNSEAAFINKYEVDWSLLTKTSDKNVLTKLPRIKLKFKGNKYDKLKHMQGGEFSNSGELFYLVSGGAECFGSGSGKPSNSDGIHVFRTSDWIEIETSVKSRYNDEYFFYKFDNDCDDFFGSESPEGLTIWDLDGENEDHLYGNLHVLVFHWNLAGPFSGGSNDHKVSMHHFSNKVSVDKKSTPIFPQSIEGNSENPFKSIQEALNFYPIWDGAEIFIRTGNYPEVLTLSKRIKLNAKEGPVTIGKQ